MTVHFWYSICSRNHEISVRTFCKHVRTLMQYHTYSLRSTYLYSYVFASKYASDIVLLILVCVLILLIWARVFRNEPCSHHIGRNSYDELFLKNFPDWASLDLQVWDRQMETNTARSCFWPDPCQTFKCGFERQVEEFTNGLPGCKSSAACFQYR